MSKLVSTDDYQVIIHADLIPLHSVEHDIEAMGSAGNPVLHGYSFWPLSDKTVSDENVVTASLGNTAIKTEESWNELMAIGLGALAGTTTGGGSSSSDTPRPERVIFDKNASNPAQN